MNSTAKKKTTIYSALLLTETLIWGYGNILCKQGFESISPLWCLVLRYSLSTLLFAVVFGGRLRKKLRRRDVLPCGLVGFWTACAFLLGFLSLNYTTATNAGFFMAVNMVFVPFLAVPVLHKRLDWRSLLPVAVSAAGLLCIAGGKLSALAPGDWLGMGSACCTAFMLVFSTRYLGDTDPVVLCFFQSLVSLIVSLIAAPLLEGRPVLAGVGVTGWLLVVYSAVFCTFLASIMQNMALGHVSATLSGLLLATEPVFTALFAFFILRERMTLLCWLGAVLLFGAALLAGYLETDKNRSS